MKIKSYIWIVLLFGYFCSNCVRNPIDNQSGEADGNTNLTIAEAQAFFENQIGATAQTRASGKTRLYGLDPGDFAPDWKQAVTSGRDQIASVDIPITPSYRYQIIRSNFQGGKAEAYSVRATQKLVIVKGVKSNRMAQYILTLIPDRDDYAKNKNDLSNRFINSGDKGGFSGTAIYTVWETGMPIRADKYRAGRHIGSINLLGGKGATKQKITQMRKLFSTMRIGCLSESMATRSMGEDNWYDDYWDDWYACNYCNDSGCGYCDPFSCHNCGGSGCGWCENDPADIYGCGDCLQSPCVCDWVCPYCGSDPCACSDSCYTCGSFSCMCCRSCGDYPCVCDDNNDGDFCPDCNMRPCSCSDDGPGNGGFPSLDEDGEPSTNPIVVENIIITLKSNPVAIKLLSKVALDRITVTPAPVVGQLAVTRKGGNIEIHVSAAYVLLEELMHRYQQSNPIHGDYKGNVEIEAKLFVWDYLRSFYSINEIKGNLGYAWSQFGKFAENPNAETWEDAIQSLVLMGYDPSKFKTTDFMNFKTDNYNNLK